MRTRSADETDQQYRALCPRLLMCMVIGYATFYLARRGVNYILLALQTDLGLDEGDTSLLGSLSHLIYGLSKSTTEL